LNKVLLMTAGIAAQSGLTIGEVIRDVPHDTGALIVYLMVAAFIAFVWLGSRTSGDRTAPRQPLDAQRGAPQAR
jgi:hypothetical protein